jgi:hypothetical protein
MNWLRRQFFYSMLSSVERSFLEAKAYNKTKEERDLLLLDLVKEKKTRMKKPILSIFLSRIWSEHIAGIWWLLCVPFGMGYLAYMTFWKYEKNPLLGFFLLAFVSYYVGLYSVVENKGIWLKKPNRCPKCGSYLYCFVCHKELACSICHLNLKAHEEKGDESD